MFRKTIIWFVLIVGLLAGGLVVVTEVVLSPERLKNLAEPYLSAQLGRQVTLGRAELSLFSGISVQDLKIMDDPAFSNGAFLSLPGIEIQFTPLSLLTGSVDRVVLTKPLIRVIQDKNDRFNFHGLMKSLYQLARRFRLKISAAAVEGGRVVILDRESKEQIVLDQIRIQGQDMSPREPFPFSLNLLANGSELTMIGRQAALNQEGQVRLLLKPFDLAPLGAFFPSGFGLAPKGGAVSAQLALEGFSFEEMRASGRVVAERLELMTRQGLESGLSAQADLDLRYDFKNLKTDIRALDLKLGPNRVVLAGHVEEKGIDLDLTLPDQSWGHLAGLFFKSGKSLPPGKISAELKARSRDVGREVEVSGGFKIFDLTGPKDKTKPEILDHQGKVKAHYLPGQDKFTLDSLEIRGPALEMTAQGSYRKEQGLALTVPEFRSDLGLLAMVLPMPKELKLDGSIRGGLELSGQPAQRESLKATARITLDKIRLNNPVLPGLLGVSGEIKTRDRDLTGLDLTGKILDTNFKIGGQGTNILDWPDLRLDIQADRADLAKLLGPSVKSALGLDVSRGPGLAVPPQVKAQGRIRIKKLKISIVPMNDFGADYRLRDSVLAFKPLDREKWKGSTLSSEVLLPLGK